jgi:hypothetical protein
MKRIFSVILFLSYALLTEAQDNATPQYNFMNRVGIGVVKGNINLNNATLVVGDSTQTRLSIFLGRMGIGVSPTATFHIDPPAPVSLSGGFGTNALLYTTLINGQAGGATSGSGAFVVGGNGGNIGLTAGTGGAITGSPTLGFGGNGGASNFNAGNGGFGNTNGGQGGTSTLAAGNGGSSLSGGSAGSGGYAEIKGGNSGTVGNGNGGNVFMIGGLNNGTGVNGNIWLGTSNNGTIRGTVSVGSNPFNTPNASTAFVVGDSATSRAMIIPRVVDTNSISFPKQGMLVYALSDQSIYYRTPTAWVKPSAGGGAGLYLQKNTVALADSTNNAIITKKLGAGGIIRKLEHQEYDGATISAFYETLTSNIVPDPPGAPNNPVWMFGYNSNGGGGKVLAGESEMHWAMEGHWMGTFGDAGAMEHHFQAMNDTGNVTRRLMSWTINRKNLSSLLYWTTSSVEWRKWDTQDTYFNIAPNNVAITGDITSQLSFAAPRNGSGSHAFGIVFDGNDARFGGVKTFENFFVQPRLYTYLGATIAFNASDYGNSVTMELPAGGSSYGFYGAGGSGRGLLINTSGTYKGLQIDGRAFYLVRPELSAADSLGIYSKVQVDSAIAAGGSGGGLPLNTIPKAGATSFVASLLSDNGSKVILSDGGSGLARIDLGLSGSYISVDNGSGEIRHFIPGGGYYFSQYSNGSERFKIGTGGLITLSAYATGGAAKMVTVDASGVLGSQVIAGGGSVTDFSAGDLSPLFTTTETTTTTTPALTFNLTNAAANTYFGNSTGSTAAPAYNAFKNNYAENSQVITAGASTTITTGNTIVIINPPSVLATHAITMPASPQDKQTITFFYGGTIAAGAAVVTTLTISANSGQSLYQSITPTAANGGDEMEYRFESATTSWRRIK